MFRSRLHAGSGVSLARGWTFGTQIRRRRPSPSTMGGHPLRLTSSLLYRFFKGRRVSGKQPPQFVVGDTVGERSPVAGTVPLAGVVIASYELDDDYRYVIRLTNDRHAVFSERDLVLIAPAE